MKIVSWNAGGLPGLLKEIRKKRPWSKFIADEFQGADVICLQVTPSGKIGDVDVNLHARALSGN